MCCFKQGLGNFSVKGRIENVFDFGNHFISFSTTQLYSYNKRVVIDNRQLNGYNCVPIKLHLNL